MIRRFVAAPELNFMPRDRRRVVFSGRVQGVGFRFTCHSLARGFPVAGYVRNLPDGRVELLAEGEDRELDAFLNAIEREMHSYIKSVQTEVEAAIDSHLSGFSIRH